MTRLTDKELRKRIHEARKCGYEDGDHEDFAGDLDAEGYDKSVVGLIIEAPSLATEVLELRKVRRAAEAFVINVGTRHSRARWEALVKALGLDKPREKRAKGKVTP